MMKKATNAVKTFVVATYLKEMFREFMTNFTTHRFKKQIYNSNYTETNRVHTVRQQAAHPAKPGRGHDRKVMSSGSQDKGLKPEKGRDKPKGLGLDAQRESPARQGGPQGATHSDYRLTKPISKPHQIF